MTRKLLIDRTYYPDGTNGDLHINGKLICHTIELPWLNNETGVSCIPEGVYELTKNHSDHLGKTLLVNKVPGRSEILIHAANNARKELRGCIAPVTVLDAPGIGSKSKMQLDDIIQETYRAIDAGEEVSLIIIKK